MKITLGVVAGITATMLAYIISQPAIERRDINRAIAWVFTRIPPETHPDCKPRYWRSHAGVITREPWT